MTAKTVFDLINLMASAQENLREEGYLRPTLIVETGAGDPVMVDLISQGVDLDTAAKRVAMHYAIGRTVARLGKPATRAIAIWDAYIRKVQPDDLAARPVAAEDDPRSVDTILITAKGAGDTATILTSEYRRVPNLDGADRFYFEPIDETSDASAWLTMLDAFWAGYEGRAP